VTLARGGKKETLERRGPAWYGSSGAQVQGTAIEDLVATLKNLSAKDVVHYGPDTGHGFARPRLEVTVNLDGGKELRLLLGAESERGVFARLAGREITYLVARKDAEILEKLAP